MAQQSRLASLHEKLDRELNVEQTRPHPDDLVVRSIKKRKLAVKDRLMAEMS